MECTLTENDNHTPRPTGGNPAGQSNLTPPAEDPARADHATVTLAGSGGTERVAGVVDDAIDEKWRTEVRALIERTSQMRSLADPAMLERAAEFASRCHKNQVRLSGEPYITHPIAVAGILAELGMDDTTIAAGMLHDVQEDCAVSYADLMQQFGGEIATLVDGVSKLKHVEFNTQQEKQAENLRKLFLAMAYDVRVIIIKLADRLHNMRTLEFLPPDRQQIIAAETLHFMAPIAHRLGIWRMKWELEDRSFKFLEPKSYREIHALVQQRREERDRIIEGVLRQLADRLKAEGIEAEVSGRSKHFYSIFQKMQKQDRQFDHIYDLLAVRVVCQSEKDCYHALGVVHSMWVQVPQMYHDYISARKANNYRSIHTKVLIPDGKLLEVQIRTWEMHREAEYGIAAHWRYKLGLQDDQMLGNKLKWIRFVLDLQSDTEGDAQGFLDSLRLELSSEQIFVFTPRGDVLELPQGSTPIDFAYRIHSQVAAACVGARVNGRLVALHYKLQNGDICEIMTSKSSPGPRRGWLDFAVTPHARSRIKSFLRKQSFEENYRDGLQRLERVVQTEKLHLGPLPESLELLETARQLGYRTAADLIAAVGWGEHSAESILRRLPSRPLDRPSREPGGSAGDGRGTEGSLSGPAASVLTRKVVPSQEGKKSGEFEFWQASADPAGPAVLKGLSYTLARCCAPIPGDQVRGYVTRGRGVTVHRAQCANLINYQKREPERLLEAKWQAAGERQFQALLAIEAQDRVALLSDVSSLIAARQINITATNTYPLMNQRARLNIAVLVSNLEQLEDVMQGLRGVSGVTEVHRV